MYLVLSWSSFCGVLSYQDCRNLHMVDSGAVNLPPAQGWMTIPNYFTALQHANRSAGRNGFPPSHRHTPARRPWKVTLPLTPCLARPFSCVSSTQLFHLKHLSQRCCVIPHTELGGGGTSLIFVFKCRCCAQAFKPDSPFTTTTWNNSRTVHLQPLSSLLCSPHTTELHSHLLHRRGYNHL